MPDRDLKLNSLSRFSKQSPRLVLEEYSHCEVPAGCGGVVLRWRRPDDPLPYFAHSMYGGKIISMTLDGENVLYRTRIFVTKGVHVFAFKLEQVSPAHGIILFDAKLDDQYARVLKLKGETLVLSHPDGSWKYSLEEPGSDNWQLPDYDDANWKPMVAKDMHPKRPHGYDLSDIIKRYQVNGAQGLGISTQESLPKKLMQLLSSGEEIPTIWIRKVFSVTDAASEEGR